MKKDAGVKYAHSASLFQFCRRVLDHKFGGIRVIDQDVGQILGFDPADCSHWKKGKKNIRSIQAMKAIAEHLGVDQKLVVDVASGEINDSEAFNEYSGYGAFRLDQKIIEAARKDYYRKHASNWSADRESEFRTYFTTNEPAIDEIVKAIHSKINFSEAPLYLPEVVAAFPHISLMPDDRVHEVTFGENSTIRYPGQSEMKPFTRYRIAKYLANLFLQELRPKREAQNEYDQHLVEVQNNLFAAKLLAPATLIRKEIGQVNVAIDIVTQLAETFWLSKTFMNRRLRDILQSNPII
jgi:hypothetical protein